MFEKDEGDDKKITSFILPEASELTSDAPNVGLLLFETEKDAIRYYRNHSEMKILYPRQIARLLHLTDEN